MNNVGELKDNVYTFLKERGYLYQLTNEEQIKKILESDKKITFYLGIDPTADSLHIGHFFALMVFKYLQEAGHRGILLIGGATAKVGDPSGKSDMRKMLSSDDIEKNILEVKELAKRFIDVEGDNPAIIINNADWFNHKSYVDFMRDIGQYFNINRMLNSEAYARRLEQGGLTFLEMGYMLMQAYDFEYLNQNYNCLLQIGGSDQWGNITAGVRLHRQIHTRSENNELYGMTNPLLLTSEGKKMGKTENGTLWVARDKTTPFDFYQYFYNVSDSDVEMLLKLFTRIPIEEIGDMVTEDIISAKKVMAYELTKLIHGEDEAHEVLKTVAKIFYNSQETSVDQLPTIEVKIDGHEKSILVTDILVLSEITKSKSEARRLINQKGISIDKLKILDINHALATDQVVNKLLQVKKGKKNFYNVKITLM